MSTDRDLFWRCYLPPEVAAVVAGREFASDDNGNEEVDASFAGAAAAAVAGSGRQSDVWSLGVALFVVACHEFPFGPPLSSAAACNGASVVVRVRVQLIGHARNNM